jgi:hypothetical protein
MKCEPSVLENLSLDRPLPCTTRDDRRVMVQLFCNANTPNRFKTFRSLHIFVGKYFLTHSLTSQDVDLRSVLVIHTHVHVLTDQFVIKTSISVQPPSIANDRKLPNQLFSHTFVLMTTTRKSVTYATVHSQRMHSNSTYNIHHVEQRQVILEKSSNQ